MAVVITNTKMRTVPPPFRPCAVTTKNFSDRKDIASQPRLVLPDDEGVAWTAAGGWFVANFRAGDVYYHDDQSNTFLGWSTGGTTISRLNTPTLVNDP